MSGHLFFMKKQSGLHYPVSADSGNIPARRKYPAKQQARLIQRVGPKPDTFLQYELAFAGYTVDVAGSSHTQNLRIGI